MLLTVTLRESEIGVKSHSLGGCSHEIPNCYMRRGRLSGCGRLGAVFLPAVPCPITPAEPILWNMALLTQPVVLVGFRFHFSIGVYSAFLANTVTYALIGLIAETMRQKLRQAY